MALSKSYESSEENATVNYLDALAEIEQLDKVSTSILTTCVKDKKED